MRNTALRHAALCTVLVALLGLTACATSPLPQPQTPKQTLAYAEASFTGAVDTLTALRAQQLLDAEQIAQADQFIVSGNQAIVAAHAALAAGAGAAGMQAHIAMLNTALWQLRAIIAATQPETGHE